MLSLVKNHGDTKCKLQEHTSKIVGTILNTIDERMKFIARLPRSMIRLRAPVSRLRYRIRNVKRSISTTREEISNYHGKHKYAG